MTFNEANTVEAFVRDLLCGAITHHTAVGPGLARHKGKVSGLGWHYLASRDLQRLPQQVLVEDQLRDALVRLNPCIAEQPETRTDDVIFRLRAIIMGVRSDGLIKANEGFDAWIQGEQSLPFGKDGQHETIKLIDFEDLEQNQYIVTQQFVYKAGNTERRADLVLLVNGIPLVVIEAKTPVRASESWFDAADQIHSDYERNVPELFVPNLLSIATEGKELRYGGVGLPLDLWGPWRAGDNDGPPSLEQVRNAIVSMLQPHRVLDLLANFTTYSTDKGTRRIKIVARYQQVEGANELVARVVKGYPNRGLIWHFQGSGKSLLMYFAARKLRLDDELKNPTVIVVVDRLDLDSQISSTFYAADFPNLVKAESRKDLERLLGRDVRKLIITTIHKFGEAEGVLNERDNIIVMVDEAHRSQEGDLGRKMRDALPNAFLFGLTGTPINRADRNTFSAFGAEDDEGGYMSRYGIEDSLRDGATKELHFEPRLVDLQIDQARINEAYEELTGGLSDLERDELGKKVARMAVLLKTPERISAVCADIAQHFQENVVPNGFGAMVVTLDRESCVLYKQQLDHHLPAEVSDIVMSVNSGEEDYLPYFRDRDQEEKLLDRFRDPNDPLKMLVVTSKLLTGFNAPILQTMYLDKPMRHHTLLQAITRTNRPYGQLKSHGLIVDYIGVFNDVAGALQYDEAEVSQLVSSLAELKAELPEAVATCLAYFDGVDRSLQGYEGLIAAQQCLPDDETRDRYAADCSYLARLWEALSPDSVLTPFEVDYRWLMQVYESVKPTTGNGKLLWHTLGAKTIELIHQNVHVETIQDDLETLILDAELVEALIESPEPGQEGRKLEIKVARRLRKHLGDPRFKALAQRLEDLRQRHEKGLMTSLEFLKRLLLLAKDVVATEKAVPLEKREDRGKAALTELFEEVRSPETPIMVERIVADIDKIVRIVRFDGWQSTHAGERQVRQALRKELLKYQLHRDQDLFDKAYRYIEMYY